MKSSNTKSTRFWILVSLCSLLVWVIHVLNAIWIHFFNYLGDPFYAYVSSLGPVYWASYVGSNALFIALMLGLTACVLVWGLSKPFIKVKNLIAVALVLEVIYFIGFVPSVFWLMGFGTAVKSISLGIAYLIQIVFTVPFLLFLAFKVHCYSGSDSRRDLIKYGCLAFIGFIIALWANAFFRWVDMISAGGLEFLSRGITAVGFFDAVIFMSLAILFAVIGGYSFTKKEYVLTARLFGLSLTMVGVHYAIYLIYSYLVNALNSVWLLDIWAISFLGLGLTLIMTKSGCQTTRCPGVDTPSSNLS